MITQSFGYTGTANVSWIVPNGVTSITVDLAGGQGGTGGGTSGLLNPGGLGGRMQATLAVTAGQQLYINVGGAGGNESGSSAGAGGFNGGGAGGFDNTTYIGGGGGGGSDIRTGGTALGNRIFAAGGGGGGGNDFNTAGYERGGIGGAATSLAGSGYYDNIIDGSTTYCGMGGTNGAGGVSATNCTPLVPSGPGVGASACAGAESGGGGGGGYYGGGAGAYCGGGGGSNFATGTSTAVTSTPGFQSGAGYVNITYNNIQMVQTAGLPSGSPFPVGTTVNTYTATDPNNNTATCSFTVTVTGCGIPTISNVNPTQVCPGSNVVLTGTNFFGTTSVTVNGTAVTSFTINSSTQITATVALATGLGAGSVVVTNAYGNVSAAITVANGATLSSPTTATTCSGTAFNYSATSSSGGVTFSWTRATVAGISNAAGSGGNGALSAKRLTIPRPAL